MEQVYGRRQLSVQKTLKATLGSKAKPTEMMATAQHKPTSSITSAEEQKSVQNWHSSPTSNNIGGSLPPLQIIWHGASAWQKAAFHSKHLA
jgi:hypothetical protein